MLMLMLQLWLGAVQVLASVLAEHSSWDAIFYCSGALALFWCFLWFLFVRNRPSEHPSISAAELHYIESALGASLHSTPLCTPLHSTRRRAIASYSVPFDPTAHVRPLPAPSVLFIMHYALAGRPAPPESPGAAFTRSAFVRPELSPEHEPESTIGCLYACRRRRRLLPMSDL